MTFGSGTQRPLRVSSRSLTPALWRSLIKDNPIWPLRWPNLHPGRKYNHCGRSPASHSVHHHARYPRASAPTTGICRARSRHPAKLVRKLTPDRFSSLALRAYRPTNGQRFAGVITYFCSYSPENYKGTLLRSGPRTPCRAICDPTESLETFLLGSAGLTAQQICWI